MLNRPTSTDNLNRVIGVYLNGDATGRAVVRDALGERRVQLKRDVRKHRGQLVTIDEVQPPPAA
jgi:hypothetical protein